MRGEIGKKGGIAAGCWQTGRDLATTFTSLTVPASVISGATTVRRARSVAEISNGGFVPPGTPRLDHKSFHGSMHHMHAHGANPAALMAVRSRSVATISNQLIK